MLNSIVQVNMVIDHEEIINERGKLYAVAIYEIKDVKIAKVWFPR